MVNPNPDINENRLAKIQTWLCLMPVFGIVPAIWNLYHPQTDAFIRKSSRFGLQLTGSWLLIWLLLSLGSQGTNEFILFRTQYLNALLTSGYFITCFAAMIWHGRKKG
jgi:hypothetical protein